MGNITSRINFGGTLHEHIGKNEAIELMQYVDEINLEHGAAGTKLYSAANTQIKKLCLQNTACICWRRQSAILGTDINYVVLENAL